jgi:hypothetical protein
MDEGADHEIPEDLRPDRRSFVKRVVAVAAFATPVVVSYDLSSLTPSAAAQSVSNVSNLSQR